MHTGEELKRLREQRGLTQAALAERLGVHVMWISSRERGVVAMRVDDLRRLSEAMELDEAEILALAGCADA